MDVRVMFINTDIGIVHYVRMHVCVCKLVVKQHK